MWLHRRFEHPVVAALGMVILLFGCGGDAAVIPDAEIDRLVARGGPPPFDLVDSCQPSATLADGSSVDVSVDEVDALHPERSVTVVSATSASGEVRWTKSLVNTEGWCLAVAGGNVVVQLDANFSAGSLCLTGPCFEFDRYLQAFDLATGQSPWKVEFDCLPPYLLTADATSVVFVSDQFLEGPQMHVLDAATGRVRWSTELSHGDDLLDPTRVDGVGVQQGSVVVQIGPNIGVWDAATGRSSLSGPPAVTTTTFDLGLGSG
jgi:hypothetical protein